MGKQKVMTVRQQLEAGIVACPANPLPWLVLADWLEEQADDEAVRYRQAGQLLQGGLIPLDDAMRDWLLLTLVGKKGLRRASDQLRRLAGISTGLTMLDVFEVTIRACQNPWHWCRWRWGCVVAALRSDGRVRVAIGQGGAQRLTGVRTTASMEEWRRWADES